MKDHEADQPEYLAGCQQSSSGPCPIYAITQMAIWLAILLFGVWQFLSLMIWSQP